MKNNCRRTPCENEFVPLSVKQDTNAQVCTFQKQCNISKRCTSSNVALFLKRDRMTSHSSDNNKFRLELLEGYLRLLRFILFMQIGRSETFGIKRFAEHEINACFFCLLYTDRSHKNPEVEQKSMTVCWGVCFCENCKCAKTSRSSHRKPISLSH